MRDLRGGPAAVYAPRPGLRRCDARAVNASGEPSAHDPLSDTGDTPLFIDGATCWRRHRFGGFVTMRDEWDSPSLRAFCARSGVFG